MIFSFCFRKPENYTHNFILFCLFILLCIFKQRICWVFLYFFKFRIKNWGRTFVKQNFFTANSNYTQNAFFFVFCCMIFGNYYRGIQFCLCSLKKQSKFILIKNKTTLDNMISYLYTEILLNLLFCNDRNRKNLFI